MRKHHTTQPRIHVHILKDTDGGCEWVVWSTEQDFCWAKFLAKISVETNE